MPKFDASSLSDVEYDFTGWKSVIDRQTINDKGVIPEPSSDLVGRTMKRITEAYKSTGMGDVDENPEAVAEAMQKIDDEETFQKMANELLGAIAELCDGAPKKESLEALGWRRFMAFLGYVMKELMSPELSSADTGNTPARLRSV